MRSNWIIRILEEPEEMQAVEALQVQVWPGSERDIVPSHLLLANVHCGGLVIGAFSEEQLVGFVFGFPGIYPTPDGPRPMHCSHMLGVNPDFRSQGVGFALKRAQWQMVRHQGIDRITWTYDPLLSLNAYLNITKLGAVCNLYLQNFYGEMRDGLNVGLPSDRFKVDWWVNSRRVVRRLSRGARRPLDLAHFLAAGVEIINPSRTGKDGFPLPTTKLTSIKQYTDQVNRAPILIVEFPPNFQSLKAAIPNLAMEWRIHTRKLFTDLFAQGYLITDCIYLPGNQPRSFYVLSDGESTL